MIKQRFFDILKNIKKTAVSAYNGVINFFKSILNKIKVLINKITVKINPFLIKIKSFFIKIIIFFKPAFLAVKKALIIILKALKKIFAFIYNNLKIFFTFISGYVSKIKPLSLLCNIIISLYITIIIILNNISLPVENIRIPFISGIILFCVIFAILKLFILECDIGISRNRIQVRPSWKTVYVFIIVSITVYAVFYINFLAYYPGGISTDNVDQWIQVQSNTYDNLHPAIHSMMIWLVTRVYNNYAFVIKIQIIFFGLMSGCLAATLVSWGVKIRWILIFLFTLISPRTTYGIMLYAWKDNAFTISIMGLCACMINIVFSDGLWLRKWYNILVFALALALSSLLRHNGIIFTAPVLVFVLFFIIRAKIFTFIAIAASFLVIFGITEGLYKKANVEYHEDHIYFESVGLPMTILGGVLVNNPDALNEETKEFLFKIANEEYWRRNFRTGNYNSVKWNLYMHQREVIREVPPKDLFEMTFNAIKNAPNESLKEFIGLTEYVWNPFYLDGEVVYWNNGSQLGFLYTRTEMDYMRPVIEKYTKVNNKIKEALDLITPFRLFTSIGFHMLLLLIAGVYSFNRNLGLKSLFLFIPSAAFNVCTMLLISGPEWRYFHFNTVITVPMIIALLAKIKTDSNESEKDMQENTFKSLRLGYKILVVFLSLVATAGIAYGIYSFLSPSKQDMPNIEENYEQTAAVTSDFP